MRLLTATSFSTVRSSNVCGVNASLRRTLVQIGHGAGPKVKSLSMQDSHLKEGDERDAVSWRYHGIHFVIARADQETEFWVEISV